MKDFRDDIFHKIGSYRVSACIYTDMDGTVSGISNALQEAEAIGLKVGYSVSEGSAVFSGDLLMEIAGTPKQICQAEDRLIGCLSKYSGVATAARAFVNKAGANARIVCGSHKKMPSEIKDDLRAAIQAGGAYVRISEEPMVYLDKNYVAIFGGIQKALLAVSHVEDRKKAIQIKGRGDIVWEAWTAITSGADIVYVDTGRVEDLKKVTEALKPKLQSLEKTEGYRHVEFAFGGGVRFSDMDAILAAKADIVGIGRSIIDAPLMDLRLEVSNVENPMLTHDGYNLLDKHELMIEGAFLDGANLNELAGIVAEEIGIASEDVLVIDVRNGSVALDVLQSCLDPERFVSKESRLLERLSSIKGVTLAPNARITSNGMLGWIAGDESDIEESSAGIVRSKELGRQIKQAVSRRVIVFPTGTELKSGEVEDTNSPLIMQKFAEAGFSVEKGQVIPDDLYLFSGKLRLAAEDGYGVAITTGGVGAEDKDYSVEAIQMLDAGACTPYIAKFHAGHGRHSKDGIRIGVGQLGLTVYIALPGPNDEVAVCIDTVVRGVCEGWSKEILAHEIAKLLRSRLQEKIGVNMQKYVC